MNHNEIKQVFDTYYNGEKNFMTPHVYGYLQKKFGDEYLVVEKSTGKGIGNEAIYGASTLVYNAKTGETQKIDLSELYHDPRYVELHLKNISEKKFKNAERYGEIKIC